MNLISLSIPRLLRVTSQAATKFSPRPIAAIRKFCSDDFNGKKEGSDNLIGGEEDSDTEYLEDPTKTMWKDSYFDSDLDEEKTDTHDSDLFSPGRRFFESTRIDSDRVLRILNQDGHGFDARPALDELGISLSGLLVRKVLVGVLKGINQTNKTRSAKLGYKFFAWSSQRNYEHTTDSYHLLMKIFAECEEFKAMSRLVDEMVGKGLPTTARTLNILICTCGEAGLAKRVIERFIKSRNFRYRPHKHSYNAIMITLVAMRQYRLIGWVHRKMLTDGQTPDVLTYNVALLANHRLGKKKQFRRLVDEMGRGGFAPDLHTHNVILHAIGMGNKPLAALNLMDHMRETGIEPGILHYTTAMDGLSRAGNLEACRFFFDEVPRNGLVADVPCYTVMVTAYAVAKKLEEARKVFDEMIEKGLAPRVFAYNAMIRGYCKARRFEEAFEMLGDMESKGVRPNFLVYSNLVNSLRKAKKNLEADRVVRHMVEEGQYVHMTKNFKRYKRG